MDTPLSPQELVRPWRRATIVASSVAAVELILLLGAVALLVAKPLSRAIQRHAESVALAPAKKKSAVVVPPVKPRPVPVGKAKLARSRTSILVLNGNGRNGAAAAAASRLHGLGYPIAGTADARRHDYATTVVMYRPGFRAEGFRLARDMKVKVVGPLDGMQPSTLHGGQLAVILGP
jgi:hypothetical protein